MSGSKRIKKTTLKEDPEFVLSLLNQNKELCKQVDALNLELAKIRIPNEMTPKAFNWCVTHLAKVKIHFDDIKDLPQLVDEGKA